MDQEEIENAFTMFNSTKGTKGTGLGLFISDKSIRQHGGNIAVNSEKSKGSNFITVMFCFAETKRNSLFD